MDQNTIKSHLTKLEKSIRYLGKGTGWLLLEPINDEMMAGLSHLTDTLLTEGSTPVQTINAEKPVQIPEKKIQFPRARELPSSSETPVTITKTDEHLPQNIKLHPMEATNLDSLKLRLRDCDRCPLCQNRSTVVFGQGNQKSEIVFIGEAPGEEEDRTGLAFVGKAGKLLTQIIHSIGLNREAVYICNIVKCRPPGNRNPNSDEISSCFPFLEKQLEFLKPKLIITMGNVATKALIPTALGIMKMRGQIIDYSGITLIPTFHPSYLLRNTSALADVWIDMRKIRQLIHQLDINNRS